MCTCDFDIWNFKSVSGAEPSQPIKAKKIIERIENMVVMRKLAIVLRPHRSTVSSHVKFDHVRWSSTHMSVFNRSTKLIQRERVFDDRYGRQFSETIIFYAYQSHFVSV